MLIPIRYLINDATIVQEPAAAPTHAPRRSPSHALLKKPLPCFRGEVRA